MKKKQKNNLKEKLNSIKAELGLGFSRYRSSVQLSKKDKLNKRQNLKNELRKNLQYLDQ